MSEMLLLYGGIATGLVNVHHFISIYSQFVNIFNFKFLFEIFSDEIIQPVKHVIFNLDELLQIIGLARSIKYLHHGEKRAAFLLVDKKLVHYVTIQIIPYSPQGDQTLLFLQVNQSEPIED